MQIHEIRRRKRRALHARQLLPDKAFADFQNQTKTAFVDF